MSCRASYEPRWLLCAAWGCLTLVAGRDDKGSARQAAADDAVATRALLVHHHHRHHTPIGTARVLTTFAAAAAATTTRQTLLIGCTRHACDVVLRKCRPRRCLARQGRDRVCDTVNTRVAASYLDMIARLAARFAA